MLENVHKRDMRLMNTEKRLTYEERLLKKLGIATLEMRRLRGDLIEVLNFLRVLTTFSMTSLLHRLLELLEPQVVLFRCQEIGSYFFYNVRVIDAWNSLRPVWVINCGTIELLCPAPNRRGH